MRYVLDSCVAIKWYLPEVDSLKAGQLRSDFENGRHDLLTPDIFSIEVAHALTRAERQGKIAVGDADVYLVDLLTVAIVQHPYRSLLRRGIAISSAARIGVYDCLYVALAEREGCELLTSDTKLINNLQPRFPFIKSLASIP